MKRRTFLALLPSLPSIFTKQRLGHGWRPGHYCRRPSFRKVAQHLTYYGHGKVACLWKPYQEVTGRPWLAHSQEGPDCVAQATGGGMDLLTTIQIALRKSKERWVTKTCTNMIYSGGRNLIGKGVLGRSGGMHGEWAVSYLKEYGNLLRMKYGSYDLTPYSEEILNYWDRKSIPEALLTIAKQHPLLEYAPVLSWTEFRDAIAAGYPVVFCASMGANRSRRDSDGFIKPSGRWYHAWLGAGIDDTYKRPGALLINSHSSSWASGPKRHDQPDGSVWIDADVIDKHCKNWQDSYALSLYKGFPKPEEDYILW